MRKIIIYIILLLTGVANILFYLIYGLPIPILFFILYVPFHVISLIFYRDSKMITAYHILQIIHLFGYFMIFQTNSQYFRLFGIISFFGVILTAIVAFGVVLQHRTDKFNERTMMWLTIYSLMFYSLYAPLILNLFTNFFGPDPLAIRRTVEVFLIVQMILYAVNIVLQLVSIHNNEINIYFKKEAKRRAEEQNQKIKDMPFFE
jgi:hypothetical protein